MNPELWKSVEEHFHKTLDLTGEEQKAYLEELNNNDPGVAREVEKLLNSHNTSDTFLNNAVFVEQEITSGRHIGPWKIIRQIGEGGMSTVYLAERADGRFEREVAIKFLHGIMPGQSMHRRIQKEQKILARLQHKNIAQLLDAGITSEGRPYFILEYVEGVPITSWCNENEINTSGRLEVFKQVCEAIQYAHQRLIVHRDLKPSNILVNLDGTVKLLDFGIAKILDESPADEMPLTRTGSQMMTPEYASPEQVNGEPITTATDVYALGLLLCELLTGVLPYTFYEKTHFEIARIITDTPPTKPSSLVTRKSAGGQSPSISAGKDLSHLKKRLKGDLDNIVLKTLRKNPARRYGSAEQLLNDIHNYQNNLPISARPERFWYKAGKFISRNRVGVAAAAIVAISLIATAAVSLWQAEQARAERDRTQEINEFLQTILMEADPYEAGTDATIRDVLRKAGELIDERFAGQPDIEAQLRYTIGYTQLSLMELDESLANLQRAELLYRQMYGHDDSRTLEASAYIYWLQFQKGEYDNAIAGYNDVIAQLRPGHPWDFRATIYNDFSVVLSELGRFEEALELQQDVLKLWEQHDPERTELATAHTNLGHTYHGLEDLEQAEYYYREALKLLRQYYPDGLHPDIAFTVNNLGILLRDRGNHEEALSMYEESLMIRKATLGENHTSTGLAHMNLGRLYIELNRLDEARIHLIRAEEISTEGLGERHFYTQLSRATIGYIHILEGNKEEAVAILSEVSAAIQDFSVPHWVTEQTEEWLDEALHQ